MTFDTLKYLQKSLPGFEFQYSADVGSWGPYTLQSRAKISIGVEADLNTVVYVAPEAEDQSLKEWADSIIQRARQEAMNATGMQHEVERRLREQKERHRRDLEAALQNQKIEMQRAVGKAYLDGKAAGRAEEMAFANGEEDDE